MEKLFKLKEHGVTVKSELTAGLTTFMTMAYILAVNPKILGESGLDAHGVLIATALSACLGTILMALFSNLPFAMAPGMGLNAYFTYTVVMKMGISPGMALFAVLIEGLIFVILSVTNIREAIFNAIPMPLKHAVGAGIGLFIAFIGLQNGKLVQNDDATLVTIVNFTDRFSSQGITALICILGVLIIGILSHRRVKGAILFGILIAWILGILCQLVGFYVPDPENGFYSLYPVWSAPNFQGFANNFGLCFSIDFASIKFLEYVSVIVAFLFVDIFDTIGTLVGVAGRANMLDENGRLPRIKGALMADALGTTAGAVMGTSTVTTFVESSAGVAEGGRTGLTAMTTALLFLCSIILAPIFISIPSYATAAALIYVGYLMLGSVLKVNFDDITDAIPAYLALIAMPLFYSISEGISIGIISYVIVKIGTGKRKQVSPLMAVLAVLFILKYIFLH